MVLSLPWNVPHVACRSHHYSSPLKVLSRNLDPNKALLSQPKQLYHILISYIMIQNYSLIYIFAYSDRQILRLAIVFSVQYP